ncbi:MAG: hypothetical protein C0504_11555 [Candidatus Solibacter sp.]|nr:hypothetical protein [Candidatus Solibacter sp.]
MLNPGLMKGALRGAVAVAVLSAPAGLVAQQKYTITTFAGTGVGKFSGDAAAATSAEINSPFGIVVNSSGVVTFADQVSHRIRRISSGTITTVAGKGLAGALGQAVTTATEATMTYPSGIAQDAAGNVFYCDTNNHAIIKVATDGKISKVAGEGVSGYNSTDEYDSTKSDTENVLATRAFLNAPIGVAVASDGTIYIADTKNHRIRRVNSKGFIQTIAGTGTAGWSGDGGKATAARINNPMGMSFDATGNLYFADTFNHRIRKISPDGIISAVAGRGNPGFAGDNGAAANARLFYPKGVHHGPDGQLYVADTFNSRIRVVAADGTITTIAGNGKFGLSGDEGDSRTAELRFPNAVAVGADGKVYVSDSQNNKLRLLTPDAPGPTLEQRPVISFNGVSTPADFGVSAPFAPGSWMEIRGIRLAGAERAWRQEDFQDGMAPVSLAGTRVVVDGIDAYVAYVSPETVRVLLPDSIPPGKREVFVETAFGRSDAYKLTIDESSPLLNAPARFAVGGLQYASAVLEDGKTFALPEAAVEGIESRPARAGELVTFHGIGFGPVTPGIVSGQLVTAENSLVRRVEVLFGETPAEVRSAGLARGAVGVYQISVVVPAGVDAAAAPVTVKLDGEPARQQVVVATAPAVE